MNIEPPPIKTEAIDDRKLFTLPWDKWFNSLRNWINGQVAALVADSHVAATVADTASIDLSINGQQISGVVLPAGVDHAGLANLNSTNVNHMTDSQIAALHQSVTVDDTTTIDISITGQQISAVTIGLTDTVIFASN